MSRKLTRNRPDAMLGGVCAGLGDYFEIDANIVRLVFILFFFTAFGIPVYLALWLLLPEKNEEPVRHIADRVRETSEEIADRARDFGRNVRQTGKASGRAPIVWIAIVLIIVGVAFLLRNLGLSWMRWVAPGTLWPILPILVGLAFLWRFLKGGD